MDPNKTAIPTKTSFFDSSDADPLFWKQTDLSDFANYPTVIESEFFTRNKSFFSGWESCTLSIKGNFLVYSKKKKESQIAYYIDLDLYMYQIRGSSDGEKSHSKRYKYWFSISANRKSAEFYCKDHSQYSKFIKKLKEFCLMTDFKETYLMLSILGSGGYGQVYLIEDKVSKQTFAAKFVKLSEQKNKEKQKVMLSNEIRMLRKLNHMNIVKLYEVYELHNEICMVMEHVKGKRLFEHVVESGKLSETETASIMKQLFLSLSYLESEGIIHRDIKPENILLATNSKGKPIVKLIDFGLGTYHFRRDIIKKCGTAGYTAPEILLGENYDFKADLYSAGIVMYICLTGRPVFGGEDYKEMMEANKQGLIRYKDKYWSSVSAEAKELVQKILVSNPARRITLENVLDHKWLAMQLPLDELKEVHEHNSKYTKMEVAEEDKIAEIPFAQYPATQFTFLTSSHSFVTSRVAQGLGSSNPTLNSFYKGKSREETDPGTMNTLASPLIKSKIHFPRSSQKLTTCLLKKDASEPSETGNDEYLPSLARMSSRKLTTKVTTRVSETRKKLKLLIDELPRNEDCSVNEDDVSPVLDRYKKLDNLTLCFNRVIGKSPSQPSILKIDNFAVPASIPMSNRTQI